MSKVTVSIPTYNRKEYLKETIESVLAQTFRDFTIAVFDNNSDYDVDAFLKSFNDDRIVLVKSDKNIGPYENFNRIYRYVYNSPYVVIFHDDDVMHSELLEREVTIMDACDELIWVGTNLRFVKDAAGMNDFEDVKSKGMFIYDTPGIVRLILQGFNLCYDSVMYRVGQLEDMELLIDRYSKWGDRPYLVELSKKGKVGVLKERLVNYRVHPGQDSQAATSDVARYFINILLFYKECLDDLRNKSDKRLFYSYVVDNLIPTTLLSVKTIKEFKESLAPYHQHNLLKLRYLSMRGIFRILRACARIIQRKLHV